MTLAHIIGNGSFPIPHSNSKLDKGEEEFPEKTLEGWKGKRKKSLSITWKVRLYLLFLHFTISAFVSQVWIYTICISHSYICRHLSNIPSLQYFSSHVCPFSRQVYRAVHSLDEFKYNFLFETTVKIWSPRICKSWSIINGNNSGIIPSAFLAKQKQKPNSKTY